VTIAPGPSRTKALARDRLLPPALEATRVVLVVGPAGCGKTTFLRHLVASGDARGVWHAAGDWCRDRSLMLGDLRAGLAHLLPDGAPEWRSWSDAVRALRRLGPAYAVVDDLHELEGSQAESDLLELVRRGPPNLTLLLASRAVPDVNVSRLSAGGELLEVTPDDLRVRSWEVEQLFREVYGEPLTPEEVAALAARTGGWPACIHLFHLATAGKGARARREVLESMGGGSRVTETYLARNVIDDLPAPLREFLLEASILPRLSAPLCDETLGRDDSRTILAELERRHVVTPETATRPVACHEALRAHLEARLLAEVGDAGVRSRYSRAAPILERRGLVVDALRAHVRAEEWPAARRVTWRHGRVVAEAGGQWIDPLPGALLERDPWLLLGSARWFRAQGRPREAIDAYRRAETAFGDLPGGRLCRAERGALESWHEPLTQPRHDWAGVVRAAVAGGPATPPPAAGQLAGGLIALAGGDLRTAIPALEVVADDADASRAAALGARTALAVARLLAGDPSGGAATRRAAEEAEMLEIPWVVRIARAASALSGDGDGIAQAEAAAAASRHFGDPLGETIACLLHGIGALRRDVDGRDALGDAVGLARRWGFGALEAWARAALAITRARAGAPEARADALQAEAAARSSGTPGARAYALLAVAEASNDAGLEATARAVADEYRLALPLRTAETQQSTGAVRIRCFGGLRVEAAGFPIDLTELRPRTRQLLRVLLLHAPQPVHREVLMEALWPHLSAERAASSLHVALSSLRHAIEPAGGPVVVREGDAYALALDGVDVDLVRFRDAVARAGTERDRSAACTAGLDVYGGDVFPEEGPAEWVVDARDHLREQAAALAETLAGELLATDPDAAAATCERGLEWTPHRDELWRLLVLAHRRAGNPAAASRAAKRYDDVLDALGVSVAG
jgi:DNA-binding SARP family transcriptional activator